MTVVMSSVEDGTYTAIAHSPVRSKLMALHIRAGRSVATVVCHPPVSTEEEEMTP